MCKLDKRTSPVGVCAEPKCSMVASNNDSKVNGFAILWRSKLEKMNINFQITSRED